MVRILYSHLLAIDLRNSFRVKLWSITWRKYTMIWRMMMMEGVTATIAAAFHAMLCFACKTGSMCSLCITNVKQWMDCHSIYYRIYMLLNYDVLLHCDAAAHRHAISHRDEVIGCQGVSRLYGFLSYCLSYCIWLVFRYF